MLVGAGEENAGAVDIGDGYAIVMKVESHNHPSAVEPFQGAATGVGGILRDIFTMGARPIAAARQPALRLARFGSLATPGGGHHRRHRLVRQLRGRAHRRRRGPGRPRPTTATRWSTPCAWGSSATRTSRAPPPAAWATPSSSSAPTPAATASTVPPSPRSKTPRPPTAAWSRSATRSWRSCSSRPAWRSFGMPGLVGLQDLGATGLTSSTVEAAAHGSGGLRIDVEQVPRRTAGLTPYEVMLSEIAGAHAGHRRARPRGRDHRGLPSLGPAHRGHRRRSPRTACSTCAKARRSVAQLPVEMLVDAPTYTFPVVRPDYLEQVQALDLAELPLPEDLAATFLDLLAGAQHRQPGAGLRSLRPHGRHQHRHPARR